MQPEKRWKTVPTADLVRNLAEDLYTPEVRVMMSKIARPQIFGCNLRYMLIVSCESKEIDFLNSLDDFRAQCNADPFFKEQDGERVSFPLSSKRYPEIILEDGTIVDMGKEFEIDTVIKIKFDVNVYNDKKTGRNKLTFPIKQIIVKMD
jgi:hypothetical protein